MSKRSRRGKHHSSTWRIYPHVFGEILLVIVAAVLAFVVGAYLLDLIALETVREIASEVIAGELTVRSRPPIIRSSAG